MRTVEVPTKDTPLIEILPPDTQIPAVVSAVVSKTGQLRIAIDTDPVRRMAYISWENTSPLPFVDGFFCPGSLPTDPAEIRGAVVVARGGRNGRIERKEERGKNLEFAFRTRWEREAGIAPPVWIPNMDAAKSVCGDLVTLSFVIEDPILLLDEQITFAKRRVDHERARERLNDVLNPKVADPLKDLATEMDGAEALAGDILERKLRLYEKENDEKQRVQSHPRLTPEQKEQEVRAIEIKYQRLREGLER
jgi:hypothetical protein